jgi:hypothetical protein
MISAMDKTSKTIIGFKRLNEEDGGGGEGGVTSTSEIATDAGSQVTNNIVRPPNCESPYQGYKVPVGTDNKQSNKKKKIIIKDGKVIKKRVKGFRPRKYKAPDHIRAKNIEGTSDTSKTTFKDVAKD